jgi:hypothetical protein
LIKSCDKKIGTGDSGDRTSTTSDISKDIAAYTNWLKESAIKFDLRVHAWVFMTNIAGG